MADSEVVRNRLHAWVNSVLKQLNSANLDSDSQDSVFYRVESLYNKAPRLDRVLTIDDNNVHRLRQARDDRSSHNSSSSTVR